MATETTTVELEDGKIGEFPGKRKMNKIHTIDDNGNIDLRLEFRNGKVITFTCPPALLNRAAAHGLEQKFGDEIAGLDDVDDCVIAISELADRLTAGEWSMKRQGGSGIAGTSVLFRALVEMTGKTQEEIKAFLSGKSQAEKVALRNNPKVKPFVEKIEAEKAAKSSNVDTEAMLGELEG